MARREGVAAADPYRELQVDPRACPEVIDAAFVVLREMVLRSEDDDAPRRLARLTAAHRTLADPERRSAHDRARTRPPGGPAAPSGSEGRADAEG